jgi:elongation factor G
MGIDNTRSIALVGHSSCGKTSLTDAFLYCAGVNTRLGSVDQGTSMSDYNPDEIERKLTINAKALNFSWKDRHIFLMDTPGYADFVSEVISSLRAVDSAVVVVDATSGVGIGTCRVWDFLEEGKIPRVIFINKLNKENADFLKTFADVRESFGKHCVACQFPIGKEVTFKEVVSLVSAKGLDILSEPLKAEAAKLRDQFLEIVAESDDALLEKYLEGKELSEEDVQKALGKGIREAKVVPVFCGAATANIGVREFLDALVNFFPSAKDRGPVKATVVKTKEEKEILPDENAPLAAYVFKTIQDPYVGQMTLLRIFSGSLAENSGFYNATKEVKERIGPIYYLNGKEQKNASKALPGDIIALSKLKETLSGDSLSDPKEPLVFPASVFPEPCVSFSIKPRTRSDEEKISTALAKLAGDDPTFKISRDAQTKEMLITGMGELHIDVMVERLKKRFNVEADLGTPKIAYKETIKGTAKVQGKHKKQSGGRGQYGDVWIEVHPLERGKAFEFVDKIFGGAIPRNFIPSVEKGVRQAMGEGAIAGYPLVDVQVILYDGSYHPVDSSDMAFQIAGAMALRKAILEAKPILLEPIMNLDIIIPEEYMGQVSGDLSSRRGRILGMEMRSKMQVLKAQVPLAEIFRYATDLRSMTGGRASYTMKFSHYEEVPAKIIQEIVAKAKKPEEAAK